MTVRRQLSVGYGVMLVIVVALVVVNQFSLAGRDSTLGDLRDEAVPASQLLLNVDRDSYQAQIALERLSFGHATNPAAELDDFASNAAQTGERLTEFQTHMLGLEGEAETLEMILESRDEWLSDADKALASPGSSNAVAVSRASFTTYRDALDVMSGMYESATVELSDMSDQQGRTMAIMNWVALVVAVIAVAVIARRVIAKVTTMVRDRTVVMRKASKELATLASGISDRASKNAERAESAHRSVDEVASGVVEVTSAVEQLSASITEISDQSTEANSVAVQAVSLAGDAHEAIERLGVSSGEIGQVVESIRDIAEQTNLLALNATIEAARAGAAGRGFSVVASEVKELADQTAKATGEISSRIGTIQRDTKAAIDANQSVNGIISRISELQNTIAVAVEEQSAVTSQIAQGAGVAAEGSQQISETVATLAENSGKTVIAGEETGRSAVEVADLAKDLDKLVGAAPAAAASQ